MIEDRLATWQFRDDQPEDEEIRERFNKQADTHGGGANPMDFDHANHTRNIASFLESLDEGKRPPLDGIESRKAVAIIEAIYESARTGESVSVK